MIDVPNIIFDTDLSGDVDDASDLKIGAVLHNLGLANLLGVCIDTSQQYSPGAADVILTYMGLSDRTAIPIGCLKGTTLDPGGNIQNVYSSLYNTFPRTLGLASTVPDAVTVYRTLLAARSSADVTIFGVGFAQNFYNLLQSAADGISGLTGAQLVAAKVKKLVWVAGEWPTIAGPDFNFQYGSSAANSVVANWPTPIEFVGEECGMGSLLGTRLQTVLTAADPVREAYRIFGQGSVDRPGWGGAGFHYLLNPDMYHRIQGTAVVNASTGINTFTPGAGPHFYASRRLDAVKMADLLDPLVMATPPATLNL